MSSTLRNPRNPDSGYQRQEECLRTHEENSRLFCCPKSSSSRRRNGDRRSRCLQNTSFSVRKGIVREKAEAEGRNCESEEGREIRRKKANRRRRVPPSGSGREDRSKGNHEEESLEIARDQHRHILSARKGIEKTEGRPLRCLFEILSGRGNLYPGQHGNDRKLLPQEILFFFLQPVGPFDKICKRRISDA